MSVILTCKLGHMWEVDTERSGGRYRTCPMCGSQEAMDGYVRAELPPPRVMEGQAELPPPRVEAPVAVEQVAEQHIQVGGDVEEPRKAWMTKTGAAFVLLWLVLLTCVVIWGVATRSSPSVKPIEETASVAKGTGTMPPVSKPPVSDPKVTPSETDKPPVAAPPAAKPDARPLDGTNAMRLVRAAAAPQAGMSVRISYELQNSLGVSLSVTQRDGDYYIGRRTHAVERLGSDSRIKSLEKDSDLVGTRYVIMSRPVWSEPVIAPGESYPFTSVIDTAGLDPGTYRCWVQFRRGDDKSIDEVSVDFTVAPGATASVPPVVAPPVVAPPATPPVVKPRVDNRRPWRANPPDAREAEIEAAWRAAEVDTLDEKELARDREILAAMRRGVETMLSNPNLFNGIRGTVEGQEVLNLYALLHAGQAIEDPRLHFASKELNTAVMDLIALDTNKTYVTALQASGLSMLPQKAEVVEALKRAQKYLMVPNEGGFTYKLLPQQRTFDQSNTQYANLGALALGDAGVEISLDYWRISNQHWRKTQCTDGGWDYTSGRGTSTLTMTEAGLASLLTASAASASNMSPYRDPVIISGFKRLAAHLDNDRGNYGGWNGYGVYGLERVGLASGLKRIGNHDWYDEGVNALLRQRISAFELLFLTRGRNPVAMNKLQHDGNWDARPWDVATLTRWLSKTFERPLIWQIVSATSPIEDWLDSPILMINGSAPFKVDDALLAKLQTYVDAGGTIFSTSAGNNEVFTGFIRTLANKVSRGRYEMRVMDDNDPFFSLYHKVNNPPKLYAMSNGVREIWIHSPSDMGNDWQRRAMTQTASWDTPVQVYLYVNGKSPMKRRILLTDPTTTVPAVQTRKVVVGRLNYAGNWDPEPGAWPLLNVWLSRREMQITIKEVTATDLMVVKPDILSITGTAGFQATPQLQRALRDYIAGGGIILAEAVGGRQEFATAFTSLMERIDGQHELKLIPMDDPLYALPVEDTTLAKKIEYRRSWVLKNGQLDEARLRGIKKDNGSYSVIFSPDDLSSGFLGTSIWGIQGYSPETSREIARSVVWSAMQNAAGR